MGYSVLGLLLQPMSKLAPLRYGEFWADHANILRQCTAPPFNWYENTIRCQVVCNAEEIFRTEFRMITVHRFIIPSSYKHLIGYIMPYFLWYSPHCQSSKLKHTIK